jgi:hypothetical protein
MTTDNKKPRIAFCNPGPNCDAIDASDRAEILHRFEVFRSRLAGLTIHHDLERNPLAFTQFAEAGAFDGADVDKYVLAAAFGLNESITLLRVEPLHGAVVHEYLLIGIQM